MKKNKTYYAIVLDRSSSMNSVRHSTIKAYNQQVDIIKKGTKEGMESRICLVTFADSVHTVLWDKNVKELKRIDEDCYRPEGWTAMRDGVGYTITRLLNESDINDPDVSVLLSVITDGEENRSQQYTAHMLAALIKAVQATDRWTITVLGANIDMTKIEEMGISRYNTVTFDSSSIRGYERGYSAHSQALGNYMACKAQGMAATVNFFSPDPEEKKNE